MKAVGFYKKYDPDFLYSKEEANYFILDDSQKYSRELVLDFLSKGKCCFGWMSYWDNSEDGLFIPKAYMNIDSWVWPDYLRVFIENNKDVYLEIDFLNFILNNSKSNLLYHLDEAELFYFSNRVR